CRCALANRSGRAASRGRRENGASRPRALKLRTVTTLQPLRAMQPTQIPTEWRYVYGSLVLAAAVLFLFSIQSALSPVIVYVLLLMLLMPFTGNARHSTVIIAATFALSIWLLETIGTLVAPFILAFVLAYILDPAVDVLERRRVPRGIAVAVLVLPVLALIAVAFAFGIPAIINQIEALFERLPAAAARFVEW